MNTIITQELPSNFDRYREEYLTQTDLYCPFPEEACSIGHKLTFESETEELYVFEVLLLFGLFHTGLDPVKNDLLIDVELGLELNGRCLTRQIEQLGAPRDLSWKKQRIMQYFSPVERGINKVSLTLKAEEGARLLDFRLFVEKMTLSAKSL